MTRSGGVVAATLVLLAALHVGCGDDEPQASAGPSSEHVGSGGATSAGEDGDGTGGTDIAGTARPGGLAQAGTDTAPSASPCGQRVHDGDAAIESRADLDALRGVTRIEGSVSVVGTALADLSGLECLASVEGDLQISDNEHLLTLRGLDGLTSVGGDVRIGVLPAHSALRTGATGGKGGPTGVNDALRDLAGLENLSRVGGALIVQTNELLQSIEPLAALTSVGGDVEIRGTGVTNVDALSNIERFDGALILFGNAALTDLTGVAGHVAIGGDLTVRGSPAIDDLDAFTDLRSLGGGLQIGDTGVTDLDVFTDLDAIPGPLVIANNDLLVDVRALDFVTRLGGLTVSENDALASLAGLESLEVVDGWLAIENNASLTNLDPLAALERVNGHLSLWFGALDSLEGLSSLSVVGDDGVSIVGVPVSSLSGLGRLTSAARLRVEACPMLRSLDGIGVESVGFLQVAHNPELQSLEGLDRLTSLSSLFVYDNARLARLDGLESLARVGGGADPGEVTIASNAALVDIEALLNVEDFADGHFSVTDNLTLPTCQVSRIVEHLASTGWSGYATVQGNDDGAACP